MATPRTRRKKNTTTNGQIDIETKDSTVEDVELATSSPDIEEPSGKKTKTRSTRGTAKRNKQKSKEDRPEAKQAESSPEAQMEQLRDRLRDLSGGLNHLLTLLPQDQSLPGLDPDRIRESLKQADEFLHKPTFVVGFAGGFNAGKSMLINALLGHSLLKDGAVPTTSTVTRITACPPDQEQMVIHFFTPKQFEDLFQRYMDDFAYLYEETFHEEPQYGRSHLTELLDDIKALRERLEEHDWNDRIRSLDSFYDLIVAYINHQNILSSDPIEETLSRKNLTHYTTKSDNSVAPLVREVQIDFHHPMLAQGSQLIDLPGLGSPDPRDEEITVAALRGDEATGKRECDAVVHVMDSLSPFRAGEDRLFQIYRRVWGESFAKRVFLVVSRWGKLEQHTAEEMLAVTKTVKRVAERYNVDGKKVFIVDGRIGAHYEPMSEKEEKEARASAQENLAGIREELEQQSMPNQQTLFDACVQVFIDGNVNHLRDSLQYYLAFYKEYLHLADAVRLLESQFSRIQQLTTLHLPALDQLDNDEAQFIEECKSDIDRQLKRMRQHSRDGLQRFLQALLQEETLPRDLSSLGEGLYQSAVRRIDQKDPEQLKQQLLTQQLMEQGPLTNPAPWDSFRFLLQEEVARIDQELEQLCEAIIAQILDQYRNFLYEEVGLSDLLQRAFGGTPEGRDLLQRFHQLVNQLGHDLRLVARNLNRVFFYEYSDVNHRRDPSDGRVDVRDELAEFIEHEHDIRANEARKITQWLLRQKMDYHFRKLSTYLPLCFLQQIEEVHMRLTEQLDEAAYPIRQSYLQRLERREIGQEVDRIRHRYRQIRASLEQLETVKGYLDDSRQLLQEVRPS